jgi:D-arabinose 5-phosphate isomerase GutQ
MNDANREEVLAQARAVIRHDAAAAEGVAAQLGDSFIEAAERLLACRGKVFVTGMGTSGATAERMAHLFSCAGTPAMFIHAADGLHGGLGAVTAQDALVALSRGGASDELNEFVRRAKARGAAIIAITSTPASQLGQLADIVLEIHSPIAAEPGGRLAMGSTVAAAVLGDALAIVLMNRRGYDWQSFEFTHPAGAVGKRAAQAAGAEGQEI